MLGFTATDYLLFGNSLPVIPIQRHILPDGREIEGDFFEIFEAQAPGGPTGPDVPTGDDIGGEMAGGGGAGNRGGDDDMERRIREEIRRREELDQLLNIQIRTLQDSIRVYGEVARMGLEVASAFNRLTASLGSAFFTLQPSLSQFTGSIGAAGEGIREFARGLGDVNRALGRVATDYASWLRILMGETLRGGAQQGLDVGAIARAASMFGIELGGIGAGAGAAAAGAGAGAAAGGAGAAAGGAGAAAGGAGAAAGGAAAAGVGAAGLTAGAVAAAVVSLAALIAILTAAITSLMGLVSGLQTLSRLLNTIITTFVERGTQVFSTLNMIAMSFARLPEAVEGGNAALEQFITIVQRSGLTVQEFANTLNTAFGDVGRWAYEGAVSLEEWSEAMSALVALGFRGEDLRRVLETMAAGRVWEAGGLGITRGFVESIAVMEYGVLGLGETSAVAATRMELLQQQIQAVAPNALRAAEAIREYNTIKAELQRLSVEAGRTIMEQLIQPLRQIREALQDATFGQVFNSIAEALGRFSRAFLEGFAPYITYTAEILLDKGEEIRDVAEDIGRTLGETLGRIIWFLTDIFTRPDTLAAIESLVRAFAGLMEMFAQLYTFLSPIINVIMQLLAVVAEIASRIIAIAARISAPIMEAIGGILSFILSAIEALFNAILTPIERFLDVLERLSETIGQLIGRFLGRTRRETETAGTERREETEEVIVATERLRSALAALLDTIIRNSEEAARGARAFRELAEVMTVLFAPLGAPAYLPGGVVPIGPYQITPAMAEELGLPQQVRGQEGFVEFEVRPFEGLPQTPEELLGVAGAAVITEIRYRLAEYQATVRRIREDLRQFGSEAQQNLMEVMRRLAEAVQQLRSHMQTVAETLNTLYEGIVRAYRVAENFERLRWGREELIESREVLNDIVGLSSRLQQILEYRLRAQELEIQRAAQLVQHYQVILEEGFGVRLPRPLVELSPEEAAALLQAQGVPAAIVNEVVRALEQLTDAQRRYYEIARQIAAEIQSQADAFRRLELTLRDLGARYGSVAWAVEGGLRAMEAFRVALDALARQAAAALAAGRLDEYFRAMEEALRLLDQRYQTFIENVIRGFEAAATPLTLFLDRLGSISNMLDRIGASGLMLPQIFNEVIPEANRMLELLEQQAELYKDQPHLLNRILQEYEKLYNRVMEMFGRAGAILPAVPLTELVRIGRMPALAPLEFLAGRGGGAFAPGMEMMGVPITPGYLIPYGIWTGGGWVGAPEFAEFYLRPLRIWQEFGAGSVGEVRQQVENVRRTWIEEPMRQFGEEVTRQSRDLTERIEEAQRRGVERGERARRGFEQPEIRGPTGMGPERIGVLYPEQVQPVRLRVQLDKEDIVIRVRFVTPEGEEKTVRRVIKMSVVEDASRRNPPVSGLG